MRHEVPAAFFNATALEPAYTAAELRLPPDVNEPTQPFNIPTGTQVMLLDPNMRKFAPFRSTGVEMHELRGRVHALKNTISENMVFVSDYQLAELERAGRFYPRTSGLDWEPPDISLDEADRIIAERNLSYVLAIKNLAGERQVQPKKGLMLEAAANHAVAIGDPNPLTYNTLRKYLDIYLSAPFNPLAAMLPRKSDGNRNRKYSANFEMLVMAAAHLAWQQPTGTWRTHKRILLNQLKRPEFADVAIEILDGDGLLKCADITLQRRFYSVDRYSRALLRHGPKAAKKLFDGRTRRPLPDAVLDEVECDYTTVDVNVWSDDAPIAYGRPKIILFRDRKSAVILGFYVFFGNPSLEAFLNGLHHACYPKDMRKYLGFKYPFYGKPLILIFDNDSHLLTDDVKHFCDVVGIIHRQCRPGEPTDKGAVERLIRTLNDYLFHNVPGSTQSNPTRRNSFDKERRMGVPQIKLGELESFIMAFICGEYHVHPRAGIGLTRLMKDTPADCWKRSILDVKMRPPLNPQTFTMAAGRRKKVTIQNGMIRLNHLTYSHPDLAMLETRPQHRAAESGVDTTEYVVYEKITGIDSVTLIDHFADGRPINVPICPGDRKYAAGKLWYQHEAAVRKYNSWLRKEPIDTVELQRAFDAHIGELDAMHAARNSQKTAEALARFRFDMGKKFRISRTVEVAYSEAASASHIDYANPLAPEPMNSASDAAPSNPPATPREVYVPDEHGNLVKSDPLAEVVRKRTKTPAESVEAPAGTEPDDDLNDLLAKWEGYDK